MPNEFETFNTNMINLGNQVRTLGEATGNKTVVQMTSIVSDANDEISDQTTLIGQIETALAAKMAPPSAPNLQSKSASPTASAQTITADTGYDGLSSVTVSAVPTETKSIVANGTYTPTSGKYINSVAVNVPQGIPIEVSTSAGMDDVLVAANVGKCYKYTGTTDSTYTNGDLYVVEESV